MKKFLFIIFFTTSILLANKIDVNIIYDFRLSSMESGNLQKMLIMDRGIKNGFSGSNYSLDRSNSNWIKGCDIKCKIKNVNKKSNYFFFIDIIYQNNEYIFKAIFFNVKKDSSTKIIRKVKDIKSTNLMNFLEQLTKDIINKEKSNKSSSKNSNISESKIDCKNDVNFCSKLLEKKKISKPIRRVILNKLWNLNDGISCMSLAADYQIGKNGKKDIFKADEFSRKGEMILSKQCESVTLEKSKKGYSCYLLGEFYSKNKKDDTNKYYKKACKLEFSPGCYNLGIYYLKNKNNTKAIELLKNSCKLNLGKACGVIGSFYKDGKHLNKNEIKSIEYFEKGCNLNDGFSCFKLSYIYQNGYGVEKNISKARKLLIKASQNGSSLANLALANSYRDGESVSKDINKAIMLYRKACNSKLSGACVNLANLFIKMKKENLAYNFYKKACSLKEISSCLYLGDLLYSKKMKKDAYNFYKKACTFKSRKGCLILGERYNEIKYLQKSCENKSGKSCYNLGKYLSNRDIKSMKYLSKSCDLNYSKGCYLYAYKSKNRAQQIKYYQKGCNLKNGSSCINLGYIYKKRNNLSLAISYYKKGCDYNISLGCKAKRDIENRLKQKNKIETFNRAESTSFLSPSIIFSDKKMYGLELVRWRSDYFQLGLLNLYTDFNDKFGFSILSVGLRYHFDSLKHHQIGTTIALGGEGDNGAPIEMSYRYSHNARFYVETGLLTYLMNFDTNNYFPEVNFFIRIGFIYSQIAHKMK